MAKMVCPPWIAYFLLNPFRRLLENPDKILGEFVQEGMIVLEPGCGMGYFTLPLARMVGPNGRIIAVEIQPKMLSVLELRARKAGLLHRIELRQIENEGLGVEYLAGKVDFAAALHMVHEVPDRSIFFAAIWKALKPGGKLLVVELKGHVSRNQFEQTLTAAEKIGFMSEILPKKLVHRVALFTKPNTHYPPIL